MGKRDIQFLPPTMPSDKPAAPEANSARTAVLRSPATILKPDEPSDKPELETVEEIEYDLVRLGTDYQVKMMQLKEQEGKIQADLTTLTTSKAKDGKETSSS